MNLFISLTVLAALSVNMAFLEKQTPRSQYALRASNTGPRKHRFDTERTCGERSTEPMIFKIVGGSFIPIESQPWVAAIFINGERGRDFYCGGSLIAPCWVLTAAHCLPEGIKRHDVIVYLGKSATNETHLDKEQRFIVEQMIRHQKYNNETFDNDIALLKIIGCNGECAVRTTRIRTVCLPPLHTKLPAGFHCTTAGYGRDGFPGRLSKKLKQAKVNLISQDVCESESYYGNLITKNMICAASSDWKSDSCSGDSGGPLVCEAGGRMFLFGVVSWGEKCAVKNKPGVYTQVTNYNKWIAAKTGLPKFTQGVMYPQK